MSEGTVTRELLDQLTESGVEWDQLEEVRHIIVSKPPPPPPFPATGLNIQQLTIFFAHNQSTILVLWTLTTIGKTVQYYAVLRLSLKYRLLNVRASSQSVWLIDHKLSFYNFGWQMSDVRVLYWVLLPCFTCTKLKSLTKQLSMWTIPNACHMPILYFKKWISLLKSGRCVGLNFVVHNVGLGPDRISFNSLAGVRHCHPWSCGRGPS